MALFVCSQDLASRRNVHVSNHGSVSAFIVLPLDVVDVAERRYGFVICISHLPSYETFVGSSGNDFIFPVVGEELGLMATLGVVAAFVLILLCGASITHRSDDPFAALLAAGITFVIAGQACINMGVVTGLLPNKGIALPFISRGGTGIVVMLTLVGLLVNISRLAPAAEPSRNRRTSNPFDEVDTDLPQ